MILTETIDIKITKQNIDYYKNLGYIVELKQNITIPIIHLQKNSHIEINVSCDICGEERMLMYKMYNKNIKKYNIYTCLKCSQTKNKKTCQEKYGVEHQMFLEETKEKIKKTCLDRYGEDSYCKTDEFKIKFKETCNKTYNSNSPLECGYILDKIKETNTNRYDNEYYFGSDKFKDEIKKIFADKYGVDNPSKSIMLQEKKLKNLYNDLKIINIDFETKEYTIYCEKCDKNYNISFNVLHQRTKYKIDRCTHCLPLNSYKCSGQELNLQKFIKDNYDGEILYNDRKIIKPYELDIYLPDLKIAIELNGLYWHNEINKDSDYHLLKYIMCKNLGIQLIQIWEDDWLYKCDIIKSLILNKIGKTKNKIYARNCEVKEIVDKVNVFLDENHIQGNINSKIKIGLYYKNELVSIMSFGCNRIALGGKRKDNIYELLRYCTKINFIVVGGANKIWNYFISNYKPDEVISYADRCYFNGKLYETLGMFLESETKPNYYYVIDGKRQHRFNHRKDKLVSLGYDKNKTERQIMIERKIYRIYDAGNLKYKYILK